MKYLISILITLIMQGHVRAQMNDNVWIFGYHNFPSVTAAIDFSFGSANTINWNSPIEFFGGADACISDDNGNLLLYSNGYEICNVFNDTISGSSGFNDDRVLDSLAFGPVSPPKQSIFILPYPGHPGQYFLPHIYGTSWDNLATIQPVRLSSSYIDMNANNGAGEMVIKDSTIISDTLLYGTMQCTKHANGRDWWIIIHRWKSDIFYELLLTSSGIQSTSVIHSGPHLDTGMFFYSGQVKFSPDGSKLVISRSDSAIVEIFEFDRCSGSLNWTNTLKMYNLFNETTIYGSAFSPGGKYLYISGSLNLYQLDISNGSNPIKVAQWDGAGSFNPFYFSRMYNAPDGKIYMAMPSSDKLHMINNPDNPDTLCNVTQHSLTLTSWQTGYLPEIPNFRLGALIGSGCDTLTAIDENQISGLMSLTVSPNPSSGKFKISYSTNSNLSTSLQVYSVAGNIIYDEKLSSWTNVHELNLSLFSDGIYFLKMVNGNKIAGTKILIQK